MVITGKVIALVIFALISLAVMYFLGKKLLKALKSTKVSV